MHDGNHHTPTLPRIDLARHSVTLPLLRRMKSKGSSLLPDAGHGCLGASVARQLSQVALPMLTSLKQPVPYRAIAQPDEGHTFTLRHPRSSGSQVAKMVSKSTSQNAPETQIGYNKLAHLFNIYEDLAAFRCFNELNAKNLLYMQAELLHLNQQLTLHIEDDFTDNRSEANGIARYWKALEASSEDQIGYYQKQKVAEIREKLKGYCKLDSAVA